MRFEALADVPLLSGDLVYQRKDHSFDFYAHNPDELLNRTGQLKAFSLGVSYSLQINVGVETNNLLFVWGYHPMVTAISKALEPPISKPGLVHVQLDGLDAEYGLGYVVSEEVRHWQTWFDASNSWVCLGDLLPTPNADRVEFASDTIAVIQAGNLRAIWLRPKFIDN